MNEIYKVGENKTMIIIAHRISTLDRCDRVVKMEKGQVY
jgi:ATP-binding cassette subfamily B protein